MKEAAIKVGVIADQTGPLSFVGIANANVARMVIDDINAKGGLLGRRLDSSRRQRDHRQRRRGQGDQAGPARQRRRALRRHLQLHPAGHQGPRRREGQEALHLPGAVRGAGVRSADLLHRPGAGAAGRSADPLADAEDRRQAVLPAVGRLHLAAHPEPEGPPGGHRQRRHDRRRGVLPPRPRRLRADDREDPIQRRRGGVQHHRPARASRLSSSSSTNRASPRAADSWSAPTSTRTSSTWCRPPTSRGSTAASTTTRRSAIRSARRCSAVTTALSRARQVHRRQRLLGPLPRPEALGGRGERGGLAAQDDVITALDHAQIAEGPGGPAEMVPGQHHVRMNMYIAQAATAGSGSSRTSAPSSRTRPRCRAPPTRTGRGAAV